MEKTFYAIFLMAFILISPAILADDRLDVSLDKPDIFIYSGETQTIEVTAANNQDKSGTFSIFVVPSFQSKISSFPETAADGFVLDAKSSKTFKMYFSVLPEAEETAIPSLFSVFAVSTDREVSANQTVRVSVLRTSPVYLSDLRANKNSFNPEETLEIKNLITNTAKGPSDNYRLQITLKKGSILIKDFDETVSGIGGKTSDTIIKSYTFERYAEPGFYKVDVNLKNSLGTLISVKSFDIKVNEFNKTTTQASSDFRLLAVDKTIKVNNIGNVPSSVVLKEFIPTFAKDWVITESNPTSIETVGNSVVYEWVRTIGPGEEVVIKYQFNLWNVWLVMLIILLVVYYAFKFVFTPSITKVVRVHGALTKGKEVIVTLEVRNRSLNELKDITVIDVVPQITQLVQQFDTLKPKLRKTAEGTALSWKLASLNATEERVINYRIKPTVDVIGSLELPSATMGYHDKRRVRKFVVSRAVTTGKV